MEEARSLGASATGSLDSRGRLLALDLGAKRVGVAVSDELHVTVMAVAPIERRSWKDFLLNVAGLVESFEARAALELLRLSTRSFMQTHFQVREIDVSKGYCLLVTGKNHTHVTFGFENLGAQLQRLEQFLTYSDDSKQELATVNLLVQRNIPVTFAKSPATVINDTIDPDATPRILKGIRVQPPTTSASSAAKAQASPRPVTVHKAIPAERKRKESDQRGKQ